MTFSQVRSKLKASHQKRGDRTHGLQKAQRHPEQLQPLRPAAGDLCGGDRPGYARAVKDITAEDANPVGVAHGGCYFSLADTACGSAMASHGYYAVTVNASYNFLRSAKLGDHLVAEARRPSPAELSAFTRWRSGTRRGRCWGTDPSPSTSWTGRSRCENAYKKTALRRSFCMLIS